MNVSPVGFRIPISEILLNFLTVSVSIRIFHVLNNLLNMCKYFDSIIWDEILKDKNPDEAVCLLYDHLYYAIDLFVPKYRPHNIQFPKWFTSQLVNLFVVKSKHIMYINAPIFTSIIFYSLNFVQSASYYRESVIFNM